LYQDKKITD